MINLTTVEVLRSDTTLLNIDFYGANIFRMFQDNSGGIIRDPQASPEAQILVNTPRRQAGQITLSDKNGTIDIATNRVRISIDKQTGLFKIINLIENKVITETTAPVEFSGKHTKLSLKESPEEYFYGGGVQNGRFSHKGKIIAIENTNNWTDGGVASPTPYYWSTNGYGIMWHSKKVNTILGLHKKVSYNYLMIRTIWIYFS